MAQRADLSQFRRAARGPEDHGESAGLCRELHLQHNEARSSQANALTIAARGEMCCRFDDSFGGEVEVEVAETCEDVQHLGAVSRHFRGDAARAKSSFDMSSVRDEWGGARGRTCRSERHEGFAHDRG